MLSKGGRGEPWKLKPKMASMMTSYLSRKGAPSVTSSGGRKGMSRDSSCFTSPWYRGLSVLFGYVTCKKQV